MYHLLKEGAADFFTCWSKYHSVSSIEIKIVKKIFFHQHILLFSTINDLVAQ